MTERRPHWDDDLIDAVFRIMDNYAAEVWRRVVDHGTPTFDIIAAVENWQMRQDIAGDWGTVAWSVRMYNHWVTAEATEARVRELHRPSRSTIWSHDLQQAITVTTCQQCGSDPYPCPTIKALDGEK